MSLLHHAYMSCAVITVITCLIWVSVVSFLDQLHSLLHLCDNTWLGQLGCVIHGLIWLSVVNYFLIVISYRLSHLSNNTWLGQFCYVTHGFSLDNLTQFVAPVS